MLDSNQRPLLKKFKRVVAYQQLQRVGLSELGKRLSKLPTVAGALAAMKSEVDSGLLGSLRSASMSEILVDFIKLSRHSLEEDKESPGGN